MYTYLLIINSLITLFQLLNINFFVLDDLKNLRNLDAAVYSKSYC